MTKRRLATLACVAWLFLAHIAAYGESDPRWIDDIISSFDAEVSAAVEEDGGGCVVVGVFRRDETIWSRGYGWADIEHKIPATSETIGRIGSISKPMTAVVVMQLVERGAIDLDDPIRDYLPEIDNLPEPPPEMRPITFRMLASHTAGLAQEPKLADAASGPIDGWEGKILESIPETPLKAPPGMEHRYSNIGYGILGLAASRAADRPFMEMATAQLFEPLGMTDTKFVIETADMQSRLAVGYVRDKKTGEVSSEVPTREHAGRGYKVPNGGVYSTVDDLKKFAAAMMGTGPAEILSAESRAEMFQPQPPATAYGLGFRIYESESGKVVGHAGVVAGYNAELRFDLDSGIGVAVLRTTSYNPPAAALLTELLRAEESVAQEP